MLGKKGSVQDLILIATVILFFGVVVLISFKIAGEFNSNIQANADIPSEAKTASTSLVGNYSGVIDNMFLFLVIGLAIAAIILAALVRVHPIFVPLFILAWILIVFLSGILSNIYQEMAANSLLATQAGQLTFISSIIGSLPIVIGVFGIILMIVLHKMGNIA